MSDYLTGSILGAFAGFVLGLGIAFTPDHHKYENKYDLPSEEVLESAIQKCQEGIPRNIVCKPKLTLEYAREG